MWHRLQTWDLRLIEKIVEPTMHTIEARTGVPSLEFARYVLVVWPAATVAIAMSQSSDTWITKLTASLVLVTAFLRLSWIRYLERMSARHEAMNPERYDRFSSFQRFGTWAGFLSFCLFASNSEDQWLYVIGWGGYLAHLYLSTPNPMPPNYNRFSLRESPARI